MSTPRAILIGNSQGQSLLEILVAIAVFALAVTATMSVFFGGQSFSFNAQQSQRAIQISHDSFEGLKIIRDTNFDSMTDGTHGLNFANNQWTLTSSPDWSDNYKRSVVIMTEENSIKRIAVTIAWNTGVEATKSLGFSETLTPPVDKLSGDWRNPYVIGSGDIGAGNQATDIVYKSKMVYITGTAATLAKSDFFIFNVENPSSPILLSSLALEEGLQSVAVKGNYAFVIEKDSDDTFVIDISNPSVPVSVKKFSLPGSGKGRAVFASGQYVYFGVTKNNGNELYIVNMTNPLNPVVTGQFDINGDVNGIWMLGTVAYLATDIDNGELTLVDISNPATPTLLASYDALGNSEEGLATYAKITSQIHLVRSVGGKHTNHHEYHIVNAQNPVLPTIVGSIDIPSDVNDIRTARNLAFMATGDPNKEFQIFNFSNPISIALYGFINLPQVATAIDYSNNYVYLALRSNDALRIITSTP